MSAIYHLVTEPELWAGLGADGYRPARFAEDGFVHCCADRESSLAVARDYFARATEPVLALELARRRSAGRSCSNAARRCRAPRRRTWRPRSSSRTCTVRSRTAALRGGAQLERSGDVPWPKRFAPFGELLAESLAARLRAGEARGVPALRALRREHSRGCATRPRRP